MSIKKENKGEPSDHSVPVATPTIFKHNSKREYTARKYRPFPDSGVRAFGEWFTLESNFGWNLLKETECPSVSVALLMSEKIEEHLPLKKIRAPFTQKPWITSELSLLARQKQREYCNNVRLKYILN